MRKNFCLSLALAFALLTVSSAPLASAQGRAMNSAIGAATAKAKTALPAPADPKEITAAKLKEYLYWVADDARMGRDTPSAGLDETAQFIADHLKKWGVKPAGDNGTYFQKIALRASVVDKTQTRATLNDRTFAYEKDFLFAQNGAPASGEISGALAYVGNGWVVPSKNINPYAGIDVRDKILIVARRNMGRMAMPPPGVTRADITGANATGVSDPATYAREHGARAIIYVLPTQFLERMASMTGRSNAPARPQYSVVAFQQPSGIPALVASAAMLDAIFDDEKMSGADVRARVESGDAGESFSLSQSKKFTLTTKINAQEATTQNVVGVIEGSDPQLKSEYVALGAHYDHVGANNPACRPIGGDTICNGADDDGSGTVSVLAIADALAHLKPHTKRSILLVWHCGEEKGLWGSRYFTSHPTVPLERVVTQLNIDMIGRSKKEGDTNPKNNELSGPNEIYVIGSKMMSSQLGDLSERINGDYMKIQFNYRYDNPSDPNRFFFRSDHFNYAQKGVPIIFYFDGVHEDYHQPTDSPDKIDYNKMERVARTVYMTAAELADEQARPVVDRKLPSELTER